MREDEELGLLTAKGANSAKGILRSGLRALRITVSQNLRGGANFAIWETSRSRVILPRRRKDAKFREDFFSSKPLRLRAFAGDIPRFGCGFAALGPPW
jgi:hypothetical protein